MHDWKPQIKARLAGLNLSPERELEIVEELSQHLDDRVEEHLTKGHSTDEAHRLASQELSANKLERELKRIELRAERHPVVLGETKSNFFANFYKDLRPALRMLRKNPGFTAVALMTLALGIGANTAIFSLINELVLRPLAVRDADELYALVLVERGGDFANQNIPYPIFEDYREQNRAFSDLFGYATVFAPMDVGEKSRFSTAQLVSANFFSVLGIVPALGRTFSAEEDRKGAQDRVAVLSHAGWQKWFAGDPQVVGKTLTLKPGFSTPLTFTIIGVAPSGFGGLENPQPEMWLPSRTEENFKRSQPVNFRLVGRLKKGSSRAQAIAALDVTAHNIAEKYKGAVLPGYETEGIFRSDLKTQLRHAALGNWGAFRPHEILRRATALAVGVAGLVLLIACANISNLLLARAEKRRKEIAVRIALGAKRTQILRQLITESLVLSLLGGGAGIFLAGGLNRLLVAFKPADVDLVVSATLDYRVAAFTLLVALLAGLAFGTIPAWQAAQSDVNFALKEDATASGKRRRWQIRDLLATGQIALSLVLLIGAGLCLRSFAELQTTNPGFDVRKLALAPVEFKDSPEASIGPIYNELARRLVSIPRISQVSYTQDVPMLGGGRSLPVQQIEGYEPQENEFMVVDFTEVGPGYFETMGIPIVQSANQLLAWDSPLVWINESFARKYWPGQAPIGKRVGPWIVNGVVKDSQIKNLTDKPGPYLYVQRMQPATRDLILVVRTAGEPGAAMAAIRSELLRVNKDLDVSRIQTMSKVVAGTFVRQRFMFLLLGGFAVTATALAALGIYGVMSYLVTQRTRELGIRLALGAKRWDLLGLVLSRGMLLTTAGIICGIFVALATTRVLSSALYGISATDPVTFGAISLLLGAVALLACWLPARRAANVDPMIALRHH